MEYDIKRGHFKNLEGEGLSDIIKDIFGDVNLEGEDLVTSYGAMREMRVRVISKGSMSVETESDTGVSDDLALETIRKFNKFLEAATGFNTKQRKDRLNKKAKQGKL
jgi:hypothetical protein